jgi:hypothetical protein
VSSGRTQDVTQFARGMDDPTVDGRRAQAIAVSGRWQEFDGVVASRAVGVEDDVSD